MENESKADNPSDTPITNPPPAIHRPATIPARKITQNDKSSTSSDADTSTELRKEFRTFEKWSLIINGALAVVGALVLLVYKGQLGVMQNQLEQMKKGTDQTDSLIRESTKQSKSAEISANAAKSASETATAALNESRNTFAVEQRPYLVTEIPVFVNSELLPNQEIMANVTVRNIGKTPAIRIITSAKLLPYKNTGRADYVEFIEKAFDGLKGDESDTLQEIRKLALTFKRNLSAERDLAPDAHYFVTSRPGVVMLPQEVASMLRDADRTETDGSTALYFVGIINYTDSFHRDYQTEFCQFYFASNIKTWHICDSHNLIR